MAFNIKGSVVALGTPFHEDGTVNFEKLGELLDWHVEKGTDGIVVLGTTGESATMTHEEDAAVVRFALERVAGRVPVIAGSGSNCTETMLEKSIDYDKMGVDGLLLITPYYNKANARGMIRHFTEVADAVSCPCILYNVPGRTGCSLPLSAIPELAAHPNIVGIKEASGDISYAAKLAKYLSDDFVMYSGNDDMIVPMMSLGAVGVISVFANVCPAECHALTDAFLSGDLQTARRLQLEWLDLINDLFIEVNPIPVKAALNLMGWNVGGYRLPLCEMDEGNLAVLRAEMGRKGLL